MDDIGHAAWAYLIWISTPFAFLAVFMSVFPDLFGFLPVYLVALYKNRGDLVATWNKKNIPKWHTLYRKVMYTWTHSIIISLAVSLLSIAIFGWWTSWMLAWPLHVFIDIFSHEKDEACEYLWPLHDHKVHGTPWHGKKFLIANYLTLIIVYCIVFLR